MDKQTIIGLCMIGAILFGFTWYNSTQQRNFDEMQAEARAELIENGYDPDTLQPLFPDTPSVTEVQPDDSARLENARRQQIEIFGESLYGAMTGEEDFYSIENNLIRVMLSSKGGAISSVMLKDHNRWDGEPLYLFEEDGTFNFKFRTSNNIDLLTESFYFTPEGPSKVIIPDEGDPQSLSLRLYADSVSYIEYVYTLKPDEYMVDFDIHLSGMENKLAQNQTYFDFSWAIDGFRHEKSFENENQYSTIAYHFPGDSSFEDLGRSTGTKRETVNNEIQWVAFKQQFFTSLVVSKDSFLNGVMEYDTHDASDEHLKSFSAQLSVPYSPTRSQYGFQFYFGPNKFNVLRQYDMEMKKLVPLGGWAVRWINHLIVIPVFDWLGSRIGSYGLIILILTIFIKILVMPFTYKSYLSMAKMRVMKPEIDALAEKYPKQEDAVKKQQATMELYRNAEVSPLGGCLPLLIQMPILIAMFRFFPTSIELRQQSFLWASDLSSYDSILNLPFSIPLYGDHVSLFTLLMAVSIVISTLINQNNAPGGNQMPGMKMMMYMMPVMMLLWFNNYSSGLSYYYLLSNLITIGQTYGFRKIVNEEKLRAQLKANARKPKKKSKFQQRYEEALKQQQSQQQSARKQNKR